MRLLVGGGAKADPETVLFQATMPGLAEEVVYRGVLLAVLGRAFGHRLGTAEWGTTSWRVHIPGILITAVAFGLWHGLSIQNGSLAFDLMPFLFPFIGGVAWGWLRVYTSSLLFPILAHNGANVIIYLLPR